MSAPAPFALLAELTHRCPLACPYCSNPLDLDRKSDELATSDWIRVFEQAAGLGILQLHLSGGEPAARHDLVELVAAAARLGLYTNLITSGIGLPRERLAALAQAGLDHLQLSVQDTQSDNADRIAGLRGSYQRKRLFAGVVAEVGLPLTINVVLHRANIGAYGALWSMRPSPMSARPDRAGACAVLRLGGAQPRCADARYGRCAWPLATRSRAPARGDGLPHHDRLRPAGPFRALSEALHEWLGPAVAQRNAAWAGAALPRRADDPRPRRSGACASIRWPRSGRSSPAFAAFRGTDWMAEPCRSCDRREIDFGGCRCQAMALTGDARNADPVCVLSPHPRPGGASDDSANAVDELCDARAAGQRQASPAIRSRMRSAAGSRAGAERNSERESPAGLAARRGSRLSRAWPR